MSGRETVGAVRCPHGVEAPDGLVCAACVRGLVELVGRLRDEHAWLQEQLAAAGAVYDHGVGAVEARLRAVTAERDAARRGAG